MDVFEFDVTVTVRKRVWLSGPKTRAAARTMLSESLAGGIPLSSFIKRGRDGIPIEVIVTNAPPIIEDI